MASKNLRGRQRLLDGLGQLGPGKRLSDVLVEPLPQQVFAVSGHRVGSDRNGRNLARRLLVAKEVEELRSTFPRPKANVQQKKVERALGVDEGEGLLKPRGEADFVVLPEQVF